MSVIIGIPAKNCKEGLKACVESIIKSTTEYDKIVLACPDDSGETYELCKTLSNSNDIVHIRSRDGIIQTYNDLIQYAKERRSGLLITQSDVLFPILYKRDWLKIASDIAQNEKVGCVTTINGFGVSGTTYIDNFKWVGQWFCYLPYRTLKLVGGFDENYARGFGADIDYTYRLVNFGLEVVAFNYWVDHHMLGVRTDTTPEAEKEKQLASERFKKKWLK